MARCIICDKDFQSDMMSKIYLDNFCTDSCRLKHDTIHKFDNACKMAHESKIPIHPLLNPNSKHYQMFDGVEAIIRMEQMYSREDLMAWAKITAMKYRLRIGNKGKVEDDAVKIAGYEAYYKYLDGKKDVR